MDGEVEIPCVLNTVGTRAPIPFHILFLPFLCALS